MRLLGSKQSTIWPNHIPRPAVVRTPTSVPSSVVLGSWPSLSISLSLGVSVCRNPVQFSQPAMLLLYSCLKATAGALPDSPSSLIASSFSPASSSSSSKVL